MVVTFCKCKESRKVNLSDRRYQRLLLHSLDMNSSLQSRILLYLLLGTLITIGGCDDADDEPAKPDNHIVIQGKKYVINDIVLSRRGPVDLLYHDGVAKNTHYSFGLTFSDGELTIPNGPTATNSTYIVSIAFFTTIDDHTEEFPGGEFNALDPPAFFRGESPEFENFFTTFFIRIDTNGDSNYNAADNDKFMDASIGTISSTGSGENLRFNFDNSINDPDPNTPVTGSFEGIVELRSN